MASARQDPVADEEEKRPMVRGGARVQKLRVERKGQGVMPSTSGHWIRGGCDSDAATATTAGVGAMPSWEVEGLGFWEEVLNGEGRDSGEKQLGRESKGWQGQAGAEAMVAGNARPVQELWDGELRDGEGGAKERQHEAWVGGGTRGCGRAPYVLNRSRDFQRYKPACQKLGISGGSGPVAENLAVFLAKIFLVAQDHRKYECCTEYYFFLIYSY
jgi:hypothetical protein